MFERKRGEKKERRKETKEGRNKGWKKQRRKETKGERNKGGKKQGIKRMRIHNDTSTRPLLALRCV